MFETKVKVGDSYVTARVALATAEDIEYISQLNAEREEEVGSDTADILEYAHFAVTKWEYYRTANRCPDDWGAVGPLLFEDWSREIGGLFVLKCDDVPELPVMAFAFVRVFTLMACPPIAK